MKRLKIPLGLLCLSVFSVQGLCQAQDSLSVEVKRISDRVAVFKIEGGSANVVALNSPKGIVVIDTEGSPALAARLRQKMTEVFGRGDFACVINTHAHGDHTNGNQAFADTAIIGHENGPDEMKKGDERRKGLIAGLKAGLGKMNANLEKMEKESEAAKKLARRIAYFDLMLKGYENGFALTAPSIRFHDGMALQLGDMVLELSYFGTSHSASDIIIHCPQEGLYMTGDLFAPGQDLYIDSERIRELPRWARNLEKIVRGEKEAKAIIPGHDEFLTMEDLKKKLGYVKAKAAEFAGKESAFFAFRQAFAAQGLEASLRLLKELKAKPDRYYTLHPEIDQFAYRLMLEGKLDQALPVFSLLAELFPDSYLAFDSMGEVYMRKGDRERAIESFQKSLKLNADNDNAVRQLNALQEKK